MTLILSGRENNVPYSLSRWTDVPGSKWAWMVQQFRQQWMVAIDQRTSIPAKWSLKPEDTLGLMFWTKNPANILRDRALLSPYKVKIHVTVTGWAEVEKGAPGLYDGSQLLFEAAQHFGPENVIWRFSPVPMVPDVVNRFRVIAQRAQEAQLKHVFLSFLQTNDLMPELRSPEERTELLRQLAEVGEAHGIRVRLCRDDQVLLRGPSVHSNLELGVCAPPDDFAPGECDTCGCGFAVDPFTINESCSYGCRYCYAGVQETAPKKRNTTKGLKVLR